MKIDDAIKIIDALIEGIYPVYGLCAWQTVKEELAQQPTNKQSVPCQHANFTPIRTNKGVFHCSDCGVYFD